MQLGWADFVQAALAAVLVGFSKTGVPGLGILIVPLIAGIVGAKASTGLLLPMLLFADFFAVGYYKRHANWAILLKLMPWVLAGLGVGYVVLAKISTESLDVGLGALIIALVGQQVVRDRFSELFEAHVPRALWFSVVMGFLAGFTTMIGNVAGSITAIYLLSMGQGKNSFMGTSAWFYLTVNAIKVPLLMSLGLINAQTLVFNLKMAGFIVAGVVLGLIAFRVISQKWFDRAVLCLASFAGANLIIRALF